MYRIITFGIIEFFSLALLASNIWTFALFAFDKRQAEKNLRRVNEGVLIFFALTGGAGAACAMLETGVPGKKIAKFRIATAAGLIFLLVPIMHIAHGLTLDRIVRFVEIEQQFENWPAELNGYRIAFMGDFHMIPHEETAKIIAEINERNVDLLLLGGDFTHRNHHYQGTIRELSRATAPDGIFGVEGNHDCYVRVFAQKNFYGITPLDNNGVSIRDGFFLAGVHDLWNRDPCIETATSNATAGDFILLVSHNPDVAMQQPTLNTDFILSAHTHAGQITFFGFPFYLLRGGITEYGTRFARGFSHSADGTPVFVTTGVGDLYAVPRILSRPEVVIFTMHGA
ncbi:MAG: DUF1294 domain-containing protein [Defluviitaleaceae bacterium]|nr:DUF1294 domain-containing protein [Defluviitaleaceae bacterium]